MLLNWFSSNNNHCDIDFFAKASCVFSLADIGVIFLGGYTKAARTIHTHINASPYPLNPTMLLYGVIKSKVVPGLIATKVFKHGHSDLPTYNGWSYSTTFQIHDTDSGVRHVVTIVERWIFNVTHTLVAGLLLLK